MSSVSRASDEERLLLRCSLIIPRASPSTIGSPACRFAQLENSPRSRSLGCEVKTANSGSTQLAIRSYTASVTGQSTVMLDGLWIGLRWQRRGELRAFLLVGLLGCASTMLPCHSAMAATADAPSEVAKEKYGKALKAYGASRYADALLLLEDVRRLHSSPNALLLLGHCYAKLGRLASAIEAYREAERSAAEQIAKGKDVSGNLKETRGSALEHMSDLEPRVPYITLVLPSDLPPDFSLLVDGKPVPTEKWGTAQTLDPGGHEVAAMGSRISAFKQSIFAKEGDKQRIELNLQREASAKVVVELPSRVTPSEPTILVDGQNYPIAGVSTTLLLAPGSHSIVVRAANRKTFLYRGGLANGENVLLRPSLHKATPWWATLLTGGLALATAGLATGLGVQAQSRDLRAQNATTICNGNNDSARSAFDCDPAVQQAEQQDIRRLALATNILFPISGALAVGTIALSVTADWPVGASSSTR